MSLFFKCVPTVIGGLSTLSFGVSSPITAHANSQRADTCLQSGSWVEMMVVTEVSSDRAKEGDLIKLRVQTPVIVDGELIIAVGTPAFGRVVKSLPGKRALKSGAISGRLTHIAANGGIVELHGEFSRSGTVSSVDNMIKMTLLPLESLFAPGNSGKLKAGEIITAMVDGDHIVMHRQDGLQISQVAENGDAICDNKPKHLRAER